MLDLTLTVFLAGETRLYSYISQNKGLVKS